MADLGSFGAAQAEANASAEPDTFGLLGERFRVKPGKISAAASMNYSKALLSKSDLAQAETAVAVQGLISAAIHPEDRARFWAHCESQEVDDDTLGELSVALFEAISGDRPTGRPSDSTGGPSNIGNGSSSNVSTPQVSQSSTGGQTVLQAVPSPDGGLTASLPDSSATSLSPTA